MFGKVADIVQDDSHFFAKPSCVVDLDADINDIGVWQMWIDEQGAGGSRKAGR